MGAVSGATVGALKLAFKLAFIDEGHFCADVPETRILAAMIRAISHKTRRGTAGCTGCLFAGCRRNYFGKDGK